MKTSNKRILVTGGGAGIGFSIAKAFSGNGNQLIITGRTESRLKSAVAQLENATYIVADVTSETDVNNLVKEVKAGGGLDILINNAGTGVAYNLLNGESAVKNGRYEMEINYFAVLNLIDQFVPTLKESKEAAIINVQSVASYVPSAILPTYGPTKAALHSYSQSLRITLEQTAPNIQVYEVFPPLVDTELVKDFNGPKLSPDVVAQDIVDALQQNNFEIRNGGAEHVYQLHLQSPKEALALMNTMEATA
ncbi:SDR family oxidoreductase [uncultured Chitinophaga sp.]|uniref:SDR family oxidoreductase n=1 Tax=uncultured Chitinophaga sp. TaxID=339340 RepID=UPI0025F1D648|nr:SDR family NAD(P)-dependent oxidoreductase [uncultured Chitinophaga sp.]